MSGGGLLLRREKTAASAAVSAKGVPPDQERRHREAEHIRMNRFSFEDEEMQDDGEQISTYAMSYECQDLQSVANDELPSGGTG